MWGARRGREHDRAGLLASFIVLTVLLLAAAGPAAAVGRSGQAVAVGTGGAAASGDRDTTRSAIAILRAGGNAIDATIAANATLGVTEPYVGGIGGGGFMVIYLARQHRVVTIDGRENAPQNFPKNAFIDPSTGQPYPFSPQRITSGMAVGVPGTLGLWETAARRFGSMSLGRLLSAAIRIALHGFPVDRTFHDWTEQNLARLGAFSSSRSLFLTPGGDAPAVGSVHRNRDLAHTYRMIARHGAGIFYHGPIGAAVAKTVRHPPVSPRSTLGFAIRAGLMTAGDIARYTAPLAAPTHVSYRGLQVYGMAPPSSGGSTVGEALNILQGFGMSTPDRPLALHRYLEASRLSYADRNRWVGDPAYVRVPLKGLLSKRFASERRCLIGPTAATSPAAPGNPMGPFDSTCSGAAGAAAAGQEGTSTNHLTVVDRFGNVVSLTTTIEQIAGSGMAVPRYGFLLNNELTDFDPVSPAEGSPDPNLPAGGKRPRSSMSPTIVLRHGRPFLSVGSPGGATIITTVLQILLDRIDFGITLPQAIDAPRASQRNASSTDAEPGFISQYGNALETRFGQRFTPMSEIGAATGVEFLRGGRVEAVAEPLRRGGGDAEVVHPARKRRRRVL